MNVATCSHIACKNSSRTHLALNLDKFKQHLSDSIAEALNATSDLLVVPQVEIQQNISAPNDEQLQVINSKLPRPVEPGELTVVTWVASHNLLSHSMEVWDLDSLQAMAKGFPQGLGCPLQRDHDWYTVEMNEGFIFDSRLTRSSAAPDEIVNAEPGFSEHNLKIIGRDGYVSLELDTAIPTESPFLKAIMHGKISQCSTGGMRTDALYCPLCSESQGKPVDFFKDDSCPHIPPLPYMSWWYDFDDPEIRKLLAPYYIRGGFTTAIELSAVVKGDLPGAQLKR